MRALVKPQSARGYVVYRERSTIVHDE